MNRIVNDEIVVIDDAMAEIFDSYEWRILKRGRQKHAYSTSNDGAMIFLHHLIVETDSMIDHINRNGLDNRRENLRFTTKSTNAMNCEKRTGTYTSKFKGVNFRPDRKSWRSYITANQKTYFLGNFKTEEEAAVAYNHKAIELHGEFACLNVL